MKFLFQFFYLFWAVMCGTLTPAQAVEFCGLDFVSPKQLETVVATKVAETPNLSDPQYQTYFDKVAAVAWAFTTSNNPAHPSVVCRMIVQDGKDTVVKLRVRCGGTKTACDAMVNTWNELNEKMKRELKGQ